MCSNVLSLTMDDCYRPSVRTFAVTWNRVYSICVSVDELYADAGAFFEKYHTHVGLLSGLLARVDWMMKGPFCV